METNTNTMQACCDIRRDEERVYVTLEMPGVEKSGLDIKIEGDHLLVEGRRSLPEISGKSLIREIRRSDYRHTFTLDNTIDRDKVDAQLKNGVLNLTLGIREAQKPRKINVVTR